MNKPARFRDNKRRQHPKNKSANMRKTPPSIIPEMHLYSDVRVLCALITYHVCINQKSLNTLLPDANKYVKEQDRALLQELAFGVSRWFFWLQSLYRPKLSKALHRNDFLVECLLCVGLYQLLFTRIPAHACLNETVKAAEMLNLSRFKGLINALLRQLSEEELPLNDAVYQESMHRQSHPQWLQDKLSHNWPDDWQAILRENNTHPPMSLRINRSYKLFAAETDAAQIQSTYLTWLEEAGIQAQPSSISSLGIILSKPCSVEALPGFQDGAVSIQDEAAQLSSQLLQLAPGQRVLDACAAPGGKTCAILEHQPGLSVLALDSDSKRAQRIDENLKRLNLRAEIKIARAEALSSWWDGQYFDRILLDAPCSATGVIRRHPDIKLLRHEQDILTLAELQLTILKALWGTLKPGGILVYATCSVFSQENSRIIERFLKQTDDAEQLPIEADWGIDSGYGRQLFPHSGSHDGFFYARLIKNEHKTEDGQKV